MGPGTQVRTSCRRRPRPRGLGFAGSRMPGSRGRTLGLGAPPRLPLGPRLAPGPESASPPGAQVAGARPLARALGSSPARLSLPLCLQSPVLLASLGVGLLTLVGVASGRLPGAEVPPAASHAPGPQ